MIIFLFFFSLYHSHSVVSVLGCNVSWDCHRFPQAVKSAAPPDFYHGVCVLGDLRNNWLLGVPHCKFKVVYIVFR